MSKNQKMKVCRNCNIPIAANAKICPSCGIKCRKPLYKRTWVMILIMFAVVGIIGFIGVNGSRKKYKKVEYRWPTSETVSLIPQPQSKYGKINSERKDYFSIDIYDMTNEQFEDYIDECKERGFTVDYTRLDGYYSAEDAEGFELRVYYDQKEKEMNIMLSAPTAESSESSEAEEPGESHKNEVEESKEENSTEKDTAESSSADEGSAEENSNEADKLVNGMRPEFKEAMDSYEAFYDEYCEFMKKYKENPTDWELLTAYTDMAQKLIDMDEKFAEWEEKDLNSAEVKYFAEVSGHITQKLLEAAQ